MLPTFRASASRARIPVDDRGLVVEHLARTPAKAVVVTPSHQYPTGAGMTADRRAALFAWAEEAGCMDHRG